METKTEPTALETVLMDYRGQHQRRKARLDDWIKKLNDQPLYAFSWGGDAVDDAATIFWLEQAIGFLSGEVNPTYEGDRLQEVIRTWNQDLVEMARSQSYRSTSMIGNVADEAKRIALARLVERLEGYRVRPVAPGVEEFRVAIVDRLEEFKSIARSSAMGSRTIKEARYNDGRADAYHQAAHYVKSWKPVV